MKIGIDCRTILDPKGSERAGVAHYSYYLIKHILKIDKDNTYVFFFSHGQEVLKEFLSPRVRVVYFSRKVIPFFHSHYILAKEIAKQNVDIFHSLSGILPLFYKGKSIITVADLSMYVNPEWFSPKNFFGDIFWRKILIPWSIKKADKIIAISENTKKDIIKYFHIDEKKIVVTHLGVEMQYIADDKDVETLKKFDLIGKKYFFFIGTIEPRKNIINIVKAFEEFLYTPHPPLASSGHPLPQGERVSNGGTQLSSLSPMRERGRGEGEDNKEEFFLVLAGGLGWKYEPILEAIKNSSGYKNIKYIGYIGTEEKMALMKNTQCFVWPSLYEGFGLPILEAMACGAPVITSNTSSIPEVAGNAAILVDPFDAHAICEALIDISTDTKEQKILRELGEERIKLFSWEKTARKTLEAYRALRQE